MVKDIAPGVASSIFRDWVSNLAPGNLAAAVGDLLFFIADDGRTGPSLWKSDGTASGTTLVKTVDTFIGQQFHHNPPHELVAVNDELYFVGGRTLWKSDGSGEGTVPVRTFKNSWPKSLTEVNGKLAFTAPTVWVHDPATNTTEALKGRPVVAHELLAADNKLFIAAVDGVYSWSGGKNDVAVQLHGLRSEQREEFENLAFVRGKLFYKYYEGGFGNGWEIWVSDGTPTGIGMLKKTGSSSYLQAGADHVFFIEDRFLWSSDGTTVGTRPITLFPFQELQLAPLDGHVLFPAHDPAHGRELWRSDGTEAGTTRVRDIDPGPPSAIGRDAKPVPFQGSAYFAASSPSNGIELWKSDGTREGTTIAYDYGKSESSEPNSFATLKDGTILFTANDGNTPSAQVWKTDGIDTVLVADLPDPQPRFDLNGIWDTPENVKLQEFVSSGDKVYFLQAFNYLWGSGNYQHAYDLWVTNGTDEGTQLIEREAFSWFYMDGHFEDPKISITSDGTPELVITPLVFEPPPRNNETREATIDGMQFSAETVNVDGENLSGLAVTADDGKVELVREFESVSGMSHFTNVDGRLFFVAKQNNEIQLWVSDGSRVGTKRVKSFKDPIEADSYVMHELLFFTIGKGPRIAYGDRTVPPRARLSCMRTCPSLGSSLISQELFIFRHRILRTVVNSGVLTVCAEEQSCCSICCREFLVQDPPN